MKNLLLISILFTLSSITLCSQTVTVNIEGIRNQKGILQLSIFKNQEQFSDEEPWKKILIKKDEVKDGKLSVPIKLEPGEYGITLLDDEDESGKMSFKMMVYPKEGVGFSNYMLSGMKKPKFSEFSFSLKDSSETVQVKLKYF